MRLISLLDLIKLVHNSALSEKYINYLCGFDGSHEYRHSEIESIFSLCKVCGFDNEELYSGFIFGYTIPQLNKEFDLLKITESKCINIELKSKEISEDKIKKQLLLNKHYLRLLKKRTAVDYLR